MRSLGATGVKRRLQGRETIDFRRVVWNPRSSIFALLRFDSIGEKVGFNVLIKAAASGVKN